VVWRELDEAVVGSGLSWVLPRNTSCIVFLFLTAEYRLQKDNIT
jgi:hypothetical protein